MTGIQVVVNYVLTRFSTIFRTIRFTAELNYAICLAYLFSLSFIFLALISFAITFSIVLSLGCQGIQK
jgi:hypothetical protein